jgi:hypothetical protein
MNKALYAGLFVALSFSSFCQTVLLGSYPFSGNADDASGNGNNGVVHGATITAGHFGNANSAYLFDGVDDYIDLGEDFVYTSHSFTVWAKRDSSVGAILPGNVLVSKLNNGPYEFMNSELSTNNVTIGSGTSWDGLGDTSAIDYSDWNSYIMTFNAGTSVVKLYINGELADSAVTNGYVDVDSTPVAIGARPYNTAAAGPTFFFTGAIDDVNIYSGVLTPREIDSLSHVPTLVLTPEMEVLNISPNPFFKHVTIKVAQPFQNAALLVFNAAGQEVKRINNLSGQTVELQRESLPSGTYLMQMMQENKIIASGQLIAE